jgi:uncharacterized protein (DUF1330 family)/uncharacterized protein YjiS (DUF1127 family)
MRHETFETASIDVRALSPAQRTALKLRLVREAHAARARAMQQAVARALRLPLWLKPATVLQVIEEVRIACIRRRDRMQGVARLRAMTDYELRDIGLSRSEIRGAAWFDERQAASPRTAALTAEHQRRKTFMSKAYWIVRVSVRDEKRYPEYLAAARPAFEKFDAKFIVRGGAFETMEGEARERNVVVEFADRATAMACYRSPEYQSAKAIRQGCADADFIVVEGAA